MVSVHGTDHAPASVCSTDADSVYCARYSSGATVHRMSTSTPVRPFRYREVESRIRSMMDAGNLRPGDKLPSLRTLARQLRVSISTVSQAYMELERKGLAEARPRSGYYVRMPAPVLGSPSVQPAATEPAPVRKAEMIRRALDAVGGPVHPAFGPGSPGISGHKPPAMQLGVAIPDEALLPVAQLARITAEVARRDPARVAAYESIQGNAELRRQIALRQLCHSPLGSGCAVQPEQVIVTGGAFEALYLSLRTITRPGDTVLLQSPTYYLIIQLMEILGLRVIEVGSDPRTGMDVDGLAEALHAQSSSTHGIRALVCCPNFNNPDGSLTPDENKARVLELCARAGVPIVEDDIYGEIYFGAERPTTLLGMATQMGADQGGDNARSTPTVLTCSSFSKTLAPGYRVGYVLAHGHHNGEPLHQRVLALKAATNVCSPTLTQLAVAEYLARGGYERHLRRLRRECELSMHQMQRAVAEHFPPGTRISDPQGGMVLWIELPTGLSGADFAHRARQLSIGVVPGVLFSPRDDYTAYVRITAALRYTEAIADAVERLGQLAHRMLDETSTASGGD